MSRFARYFLLFAVVALSSGCGSKSQPDPLAGWKKWSTDTGYHLDKAITNDLQNYIKTLPPQQREIAAFPYSQLFCEDGTGQHAVEISIPLNGTFWKHVLIYDKTNRRVKTVKYRSGRYMS
jgi:hypothetical protein